MGKKTTDFIVAVEILQNECKNYLDQYVTKSELLAGLDVRNDDALETLKARLKELLAEHKDRATANRAAATDPVVIKCQKVMDDCSTASSKACSERSRVKDEIFNRLAKMDSKLKVFEAYIAKKAKSKNPFKSKKSIPAAKDFIAASKVFHENSDAFFKSIGGLDAFPV